MQTNAHGSIEKSLTPLLPAKYMEAACAQCHASYDSKKFTLSYLPQMTTIARGEQLFKAQACYGCHKIEGFSKGNIGPELTYEGRVAGTLHHHRASALGPALQGQRLCHALLLRRPRAQHR